MSEDELETTAFDLIGKFKDVLNQSPEFIKALCDHYWGESRQAPGSDQRDIKKEGVIIEVHFSYNRKAKHNYQWLQILRYEPFSADKPESKRLEWIKLGSRLNPTGATKGTVEYHLTPEDYTVPSENYQNTKKAIEKVRGFLEAMRKQLEA